MKAVPLLKETYDEWSSNKAPRLAAALSYYTLFALAPLLVLAIEIGALIIGAGQAEGHHREILGTVRSHLEMTVGSSGADAVMGAVQATVDNQKAGAVASIIGWITLLVAAGGLFGSLRDALNTIWEVPPDEDQTFWEKVKARFVSFAMIGGVAFLFLVSLMANAVVHAMSGYIEQLFPAADSLIKVVNILLSLGLATLLFAIIFKYLPDTEVHWKDVWVGALITAVLFGVGQALLGLYLAKVAAASAYGAAGSLVIVMIWVYYSSQILLFGAEFTRVYSVRVTAGNTDPEALDKPVAPGRLAPA